MTTLISSDWHLSDNPRDDYRFNFVDKTLVDLMKKHDVDQLIIGGDITESKDQHGAWLVNRIVETIVSLARFPCNLIINRGNHDYLSADNPFFKFVEQIDSCITWVNEPKELMLVDLGKTLFLPHTINYKKDWEGLDFDKPDFILAHNSFEGADAGNGKKLSGIPLSVFPKTAKVISGDIHIPQTFGCLTYIGAPFLVDHGDDYKPRILLVDKGKVQSIPVFGNQKRLCEISSLADLSGLLSQNKIQSGDILKIRVFMAQKDYADWPATRESIREWAEKARMRVTAISPVLTLRKAKKIEKDFQHKTDEEIFASYTKSRSLDQLTIRVGESLLRKS